MVRVDAPQAVDRSGNELLRFVRGPESLLGGLDAGVPLPLSLVVARHAGEVLLVFDRWRQQWELPGGGIEPGETPRAAAVRELEEETGHAAPHLDFVGLALFRLQPDRRLEHAAVYTGVLAERVAFEPNDEIERVSWWDGEERVPHLAGLDAVIARLSLAD